MTNVAASAAIESVSLKPRAPEIARGFVYVGDACIWPPIAMSRSNADATLNTFSVPRAPKETRSTGEV